MTVQHHPGDDLLISYAAGAIGESWSLAVAAHLAHCPQCRLNMGRAEEVGGVLLGEMDPVAMASDSLDYVLDAIHDTSGDQEPGVLMDSTTKISDPISCLPLSVQEYVGADLDSLSWRGKTSAHPRP